jgi:hypothetical protein
MTIGTIMGTATSGLQQVQARVGRWRQEQTPPSSLSPAVSATISTTGAHTGAHAVPAAPSGYTSDSRMSSLASNTPEWETSTISDSRKWFSRSSISTKAADPPSTSSIPRPVASSRHHGAGDVPVDYEQPVEPGLATGGDDLSVMQRQQEETANRGRSWSRAWSWIPGMGKP